MQPKNAILFFIFLATTKTVLSVEIIERGKKYSEDPRNQYKVRDGEGLSGFLCLREACKKKLNIL